MLSKLKSSLLPNISSIQFVLYLLAAILIGRAVITQNYAAPALEQYAHGVSDMPFRSRYLMTPVLRWAETSALLNRAANSLRQSSQGPMQLMMQLTDVLCLIAMGPLVVRLRNCFQPPGIFPWLAPLALLWIVTCTYIARYESGLFVPYDLLSMVFFTIGLIGCVESRWWLLLLAVAIGTYNRETTVFLLPIWMACNWYRSRATVFSVAVAGLVLWGLVRLQILAWLSFPPSGILFVWYVNERMLLYPHHWPQMMSVAGFLVIPLWLWRGLIGDALLKRAWIGTIPLIMTVLAVGWWNETRIFGELTAVLAVTASIEFEEYLRRYSKQLGLSQS